MRGGREAVQALISRDVTMLQQGSAGVILAWAQGAKDLGRHRRHRQQARLRLRQPPRRSKSPADLKGKRIAISQLGASTDFIARVALRQLGLSDKDVTLLGLGAQGERWAALAGGHVDASVFQPPVTLRARKTRHADLGRFFQKRLRICRRRTGDAALVYQSRPRDRDELHARPGRRHGLLPRREKQRRGASNIWANFTSRTMSRSWKKPAGSTTQVTPGLPVVTMKAMENMIASDRMLSTMNINRRRCDGSVVFETAGGRTERLKDSSNRSKGSSGSNRFGLRS